MKKTFWITLGLFVLSLLIVIVQWDVVQERSFGFQLIFLFGFLLLVFIIKFAFLSIVLIPLIILVVVLLVRKIESAILKTIALSFFMFFTAINLIGAVSLLGEKTTKETIIESFGGEENMLAVVKERIIAENPTIEFQLVKQEIEEDENELYIDAGIELPLLNYVFDVVFTDEDGTIYKGSLETTVMCSGGEEEDCHLLTDEFKNLKTADGIAYEVVQETEEEEIERVFAEDYEVNFWEVNPRY